MNVMYLCTPVTGERDKDMDAARKAANYFRLNGLAISPVLAFSNLESSDWVFDNNAEQLLDICTSVAVFADEVTEQMIGIIKKAQEKKLTIRFYDADRNEINYDALIINKRIGPGYRKMIAEAHGETCCSGSCPYGSECCVKQETGTKKSSEQPEKTIQPKETEPARLLFRRLFGKH